MDEQAQIELRGSVEDVTFYRPDTGFTVLDLNSEGELVTVVGVLPALSAGEELRLMGHWDVHASFGRQFRAELCERSLPLHGRAASEIPLLWRSQRHSGCHGGKNCGGLRRSHLRYS